MQMRRCEPKYGNCAVRGGRAMDILENMVTTNIPTDSEEYYVAEVHMAVGRRLSQEPDYWVCRRGSEIKVFLGSTLSREKVEKVISLLENGR